MLRIRDMLLTRDVFPTEEWEQDEEKDSMLLKKKEEKEKECHL